MENYIKGLVIFTILCLVTYLMDGTIQNVIASIVTLCLIKLFEINDRLTNN